MGNWNLKEFKAFCLNSQFDKAWFYTESLSFKFNAAIYHRESIKKKIAELSIPPANLEKAAIDDNEVAFELDALMVGLDSIWDILGQFLRVCFIYDDLPESTVYFDRICKKYLTLLPKEIGVVLGETRRNQYYEIIKAYANVSKHRYSIPGEVQIDLGERPYNVSYDINEFEYKGQKYKLTIEEAFKCL